MIQQLLEGTGLIGGDRKISLSGTILEAFGSPSSSPSPSATVTATGTAATNNSGGNSSASENLRCPRCDSSNTKFCYYNNYNLTQPRHFCKTCRRYWTKGGALRNVPIGGGCRKNKTTTTVSTTTTTSSVGKSSNSSKMRTLASEIGSSSFGHGFDHHEFPSSSTLWASPQNSHVLALVRSSQNPNPNPSSLSNPLAVKEKGGLIGTHLTTEPRVATGAINGLSPGSESLGQVPSLGLCSTFWKNNHQQQQQNGFIVGHEAQNTGIQDLYQRLRSSTSYSADNNPSVILSNVAPSSTSTILDSAPVSELGYCWNPAFSWSDLPTTNGAYP